MKSEMKLYVQLSRYAVVYFYLTLSGISAVIASLLLKHTVCMFSFWLQLSNYHQTAWLSFGLNYQFRAVGLLL